MNTRCIERIVAIRHQRGWSQARLASELQLVGLDLSRATISKIERNERRLDPDELNYFALALRTDPNDLTGWDAFRRNHLLKE